MRTAGDDAVVQADRAFWADYANDNPEGACSGTFGYADGHVVSMTGAFLNECISSFAAHSSAGTSLTVGSPVVYNDDIALVDVTGRVCGAEASAAGDCATVPELTEDMPDSPTVAGFGRALSTIITTWQTATTGWTPDVLVKVNGTWHPLLPIADPVAATAAAPDPAQPSSGETQATKPWTDQDWNQTCASGGCGAVPGLPPFVPGGGLSFDGG